jgi:2-octaprenylphenol hydroxylase
MQSFDVTIVGGGMVGLTLAHALKNSALSVAVIDTEIGSKALTDTPELRVSALNLASQNIFENLNVWEHMLKHRLQAYEGMEVWDKDTFSKIEFSHRHVDTTQLGYIIENQLVRNVLWDGLSSLPNVQVFAPAKIAKLAFGQQEVFISLEDGNMLSTRLVVGADGANSFVRQQAALPQIFWDYDQHAIVATVKTEIPHQAIARQIFTPTGPLAFLPLYQDNLCSIVWSQDVDEAERLFGLSDAHFNQHLTSAFDAKLGLCEAVSERVKFPLKMRYSKQWVKDRVALIGDAAHTIHPLAGQGANLGILDAAALAEQLLELSNNDLDVGLAKHLRPYERWRKTEASKMIAAMETFKRLFEGKDPIKKLVRGIGLSMFNTLPVAKHQIIKQAMGIDGQLPSLAKKKRINP